MGPKLSPKEPAGSQDAAAQVAADKAAMEALLKGVPAKTENVKMPPVDKMKKEYTSEMAKATSEYTKNLRQSLEESGGALTNPKSRDKLEAMAKATGFWSEEKNEETGKVEGKITDIDGFVSRVEYLIKQTTVELAKKMPFVRESAEAGTRVSELDAPIREKGSMEDYVAAAEVMAIMDHFGYFYNKTRPDAKFGFGDSGGKICKMGSATLTYEDGSEKDIGAARIFVCWNGPIKESVSDLGTV